MIDLSSRDHFGGRSTFPPASILGSIFSATADRALRLGQFDHRFAAGAAFGVVRGGAGVDQHQSAKSGGIVAFIRQRNVPAHGEPAQHAGQRVNLREQEI